MSSEEKMNDAVRHAGLATGKRERRSAATIADAIGVPGPEVLTAKEAEIADLQGHFDRLQREHERVQQELLVETGKVAGLVAQRDQALEDIKGAVEARRYAEQECVKAKGEEARLRRELASAVTKNRDLFDTKCEAVRKEQDAKREALLYRKQVSALGGVPRDPPERYTADDFDIAAEALYRGVAAAMRGVVDMMAEIGRALGDWLQSEDGQRFLAELEETNRRAKAKALDELLTPKPGEEVATPPAADPGATP